MKRPAPAGLFHEAHASAFGQEPAPLGARTDLPPLVADFVKRNLPPGPPPVRIRFEQTGQMQLKPGHWLDFEAEQEASAAQVEFAWRARFRIAPLVSLRVTDGYRAGDGALEVRLFGLPLQRMGGDDFARGEAMRYLAELPWVPQAIALNRELEWRELDRSTIEVATSVMGWRAALRLHFDGGGDIAAVTAEDRPRAVGKRAVATPFAGEFYDYAFCGGVRVPTKAEVRWELEDGPFVCFRARITSFRPAVRAAFCCVPEGS